MEIVEPPNPFRRKAAALLLLVGTLVYASAVNKGFVFDDAFWITTHPSLNDAGEYVWRSAARPLVAATVLLNHRLGGLKPTGYHAFNVAVHLAAALTAFALLARLLARPTMPEALRTRADKLAFAAALLWLVHPLNTQAVTYVIQRAESMMGLCVLLATYCWVRGSERKPWLWLPLALTCFYVGMAAKEVAIVWPLLAVALDRVFLAGRWRTLLKERWWAYLALGGLWAWLLAPVLLAAKTGQEFGIGFGLGTSPTVYALTETEVVWHYLRLAVWPTGQVGDYSGWPLAKGFADVWPAALGIAALVLAMLAALVFRPKFGFALLWPLLVLAPTSTVMPISDVAFEHRMYLPLIAVLLLLVLAADAVLRKLRTPRAVAVGLLVVAVALLGRQTVRRNEVYRGNAEFFGDVLAKRPGDPRALGAVAEMKILEGKLDEAGPMLAAMRARNFNSRGYLLNVARWHTERGEPEKARPIFAGMATDPWPFAWRFWAGPYPRLLLATGDPDEASRVCTRLTEFAPARAEGFALLAAAELAAGNGGKPLARWAWEKAAALDPKIGAGLHAEARRLAFNATGLENERLKAFRRELAFHLAHAAVAFGTNPSLEEFDTLAMTAAVTDRWPTAVEAAVAGYEAARCAADERWQAAFRQRLERYLNGGGYASAE